MLIVQLEKEQHVKVTANQPAEIIVKVFEIGRGKVRLGIEAPREAVEIQRERKQEKQP